MTQFGACREDARMYAKMTQMGNVRRLAAIRAAALAMSVIAIGALTTEAIAIGSAAGVPSPSATSNRQAAEATATQMLKGLPLPSGATEVASDESAHSLLSSPGMALQRTPELVSVDRFWRVPSGPEAVISWIESHPPAGSTLAERGSGGRVGVTTTWEATFSFPATRGVLSTVLLSVLVAEAQGGGTAMRADAQIVWTRPRPALERIPAGVKLVTVSVRDRRRGISFTQNIGAHPAAKAIVSLIEGLQRPEEGTASCPADTGRDAVIGLAFRKRPGARPLVRVRIDDNGCGEVRFWRGAHQQPLLGEPWEATKALHRLLGRRL